MCFRGAYPELEEGQAQYNDRAKGGYPIWHSDQVHQGSSLCINRLDFWTYQMYYSWAPGCLLFSLMHTFPVYFTSKASLLREIYTGKWKYLFSLFHNSSWINDQLRSTKYFNHFNRCEQINARNICTNISYFRLKKYKYLLEIDSDWKRKTSFNIFWNVSTFKNESGNNRRNLIMASAWHCFLKIFNI